MLCHDRLLPSLLMFRRFATLDRKGLHEKFLVGYQLSKSAFALRVHHVAGTNKVLN